MTSKHLLLALLLGAACGGAVAWTLRDPGETAPEGEPLATTRLMPHETEDVLPVPPPREHPREPTLQGSPDAVGQNELEGRLERVEAQLTEVVARLTALEAGPEKPDLGALSDEELTARASSLYVFKNFAGAVEAYEALLAREPELDAEARGKVLSTLAQCHRALGNLKQADAAFLQVEALHGPGTPGALTAHYHRAWIRHAQSDLEGARAFMRDVARNESSPTFWRLFSRVNAADFSIQLGDTAHVRSDLEEFKAELAGDDSPTAQRVRTYVNNLLDRMDG